MEMCAGRSDAGPEPAALAELDRLAGGIEALGVAVSGGGDSVALLHFAHRWGRARGIRIEAATVDHRLRPESAAEAAAVSGMAAALGVPHEVLVWQHQGVAGNLMDAARRARLGLLADWAADRGIATVALGHTQDDQAETLLMRLSRGAGLDGLSGMAAVRAQGGIRWLRPMLGLRRGDLREWLHGQGVAWFDDPSNDDPGYDRVRVRQAIAALDLPVAGLARSAANLAEARGALAEAAVAAAAGAEADRGVLRLPLAGLTATHPEIRRRLVAAALRWVTGADYPPRGDEIGRLAATLAAGGQGTLDGVIARARGDVAEFLREPAAAARVGAAGPGRGPGPRGIFARKKPGEVIWDRRWRLSGVPDDAIVTAVGMAALSGRDWRGAGLSRDAAAASPCVTLQDRVTMPLIEPSCITARPLRGLEEFFAILRAH